MLFSQLINLLKETEAGLKEFEIGEDPEIITGGSIEKAACDQLSFLERESYLIKELKHTNAAALLLPDELELANNASNMGKSWAVFEDPRLAFAESLELLTPRSNTKAGIHQSAVMGENVTLGKGISIGANVTIGNNCQIGDEAIIHPGVVIYDDVKIGKETELHGNCVLHRDSIIGDSCIIHSNAVIGSEGFGFVPTKKGWRKMPQTGYVVVGSDVEIGCNTTIDRPSVGQTLIEEGTKIDNLVQIGHGVKIGKRCAMASQVGIAGGATIGDGVILAGQVGIANRVIVGNGVIASSRCGITKDVESGQVVSGFPAIPNKLWLRCSATFKKLPEIAKLIRQLNREDSR